MNAAWRSRKKREYGNIKTVLPNSSAVVLLAGFLQVIWLLCGAPARLLRVGRGPGARYLKGCYYSPFFLLLKFNHPLRSTHCLLNFRGARIRSERFCLFFLKGKSRKQRYIRAARKQFNSLLRYASREICLAIISYI